MFERFTERVKRTIVLAREEAIRVKNPYLGTEHILLGLIRKEDGTGVEILKISKEVSPQTKVIVNTGYVDQEVFDETEKLGRDAFLQKPFDLTRLKEEVDRLLSP